MIRRALLCGVATAALLVLPSLSQAQMMTIPGNMAGGRGGYYRGGGWGGYYNPGYYNQGWSGYYNPGYYYSSPGNYNQGYAPGYYSQGTGYGGYQSFYPSNPNPNQAYVRLQVPQDAEVWFDGQKTQSTGPDRLYVTPPLDRSKNYSYEIKARWMENGQPVERTRTVNIQAGTQASESFLGRSDEQPRRDSGTRND
jgi:uncharacterized protein (TIGR03000 family)